jgi:histidine triad (HIT) family protein
MTASNPSSCIFCKIVSGQIPSPRIYEDSDFIVIRDIQPQAKTHLLVLPKAHVASLADAFPGEGEALPVPAVERLLKVATQVARKEGLVPGGFRTVINTGAGGGQTVFHLHVHLLAGDLGGSFG